MLRLIHLFASHAKTFSLWYAILEIRIYLDIRLLYAVNKPLSSRLLNKKANYILDWLNKQFSSEITKFMNKQPGNKPNSPNSPIWTCWWQGEKEAPLTVKQCWASLKKHAKDHPLIIITADNYTQFCDIPISIQQKFRQGLISPQLMSDYLRVSLLDQHGGLWADATIFACRDIPSTVFSLPIYNVKSIDDSYPLSKRVLEADAWQIYFIASHPHSVTYSFIAECLTHYWQEFDTPIDYYLTYYLAKIARDKLEGARKEYEQIPPNNEQVELLEPILCANDTKIAGSQSFLFTNSTFIYKLSWRKKYPNKTSTGKQSFASQFLNGQLDQ